MFKKRHTPIAAIIASFSMIAMANADVTVIANLPSRETLSQQQVRNLYLGTSKFGQVELLDQMTGAAKNEFYETFLDKTENQMRRQWSVLVFSGNRAPLLLQDDQAVIDYIRHHPKTVGYVSSQFLSQWQTKHKSDEGTPLAILFTIH